MQGVFFGQLLGMADQLTFPLGRSGYRVRVVLCEPVCSCCIAVQDQLTCRGSCCRMAGAMLRCHSIILSSALMLDTTDLAQAYKYVPFGPVDEVMPYLIRRAQENSDLMGGVGHEMSMLRRELWRRMVSRNPVMRTAARAS